MQFNFELTTRLDLEKADMFFFFPSHDHLKFAMRMNSKTQNNTIILMSETSPPYRNIELFITL